MRAAALLVLCLPLAAADPVLSGALERVLTHSIAFRLADGRLTHARLPNLPELSADAIAAKYHVADQVQLTFRQIAPEFDREAGLHLALELKRMRLVRAASLTETEQVSQILARASVPNLLHVAAPAETGDAAQLQHVREVNLEYASRLPNFVADETARRFTGSVGSTRWKPFSTVESEIAIKDTQVERRRMRVDGKPWNNGHPAGYLPNTGFGAELKPLFDPACPTRLIYEGREEFAGKQVLVYGYSSPADGCFSVLGVGGVRHNAARMGRVLVSEADGNLVRFEEEATGFPEDFGFDYRKQTVTWDRVKIGDSVVLAPVAADFYWLTNRTETWHVAIEYRNHRRFEASSSVTFR
jgi:hypothetical protein